MSGNIGANPGPVAREDMGLTLPHEHLFNDLSSVVDAPCYPFSQ
ncbi:phosphotriesterase-related protein, partial [Escherichia coli]|nr:phosphotriesterase-related protein [Escherichia coli]MCV8701329.1 phosphotriesterase-related protein [Escherichia coli]